jgi:hypothetical protein
MLTPHGNFRQVFVFLGQASVRNDLCVLGPAAFASLVVLPPPMSFCLEVLDKASG